MIRVLYEPLVPRLTVRGHAGFSAPGTDIVCAAASMLVQTLKAAVGAGEIGKGEAVLSGRPEEGPVFEALSHGFRLLAQEYPQCVVFEEENGGERIATSLRSSQ